MHEASKQTRDNAERLVVINLLNEPRGRERARIYRALRGTEQETIDHAIESLEKAGVLVVAGKLVWASAALVRLEQLSMIGV